MRARGCEMRGQRHLTVLPTARRRARRVGVLLGILWLGGCDRGGDLVGPGTRLTSFERAVVAEVAIDHITDLFWVADGTHGGPFPRLAFAFGLPGVHAGLLGSATTDASFEPRLYDPSCSPAAVAGLLDCLRLRRLESGDWEFEAYYTIPLDQTPRVRPDVSYDGETEVTTVRFAPQPYRAWLFRTADQDVVAVSADVDERFTVTSVGGASLDVSVTGTLESDLAEPQEVRVELFVRGAPACPELLITFHGIQHGDLGGEIRCGVDVRATVAHVPGELPRVVWRD